MRSVWLAVCVVSNLVSTLELREFGVIGWRRRRIKYTKARAMNASERTGTTAIAAMMPLWAAFDADVADVGIEELPL